MGSEDPSVILARVDANMSNLMTQMRELKDNQREMVTRERLEIEVRAREADTARFPAQWDRAMLEGAKLRDSYALRVDALESDRDQLRGGFRLAVVIGSVFLTVIGFFVGHLYIK